MAISTFCVFSVPSGRTEHGFDFMVFYADDSMSKVYGEAVYTGGNDGYNANWPGVGGRPPLEIPACHFIFQWKTDSIVSLTPFVYLDISEKYSDRVGALCVLEGTFVLL